MASEADQGERSEEATQQRREDFRKRGQVAQTRELGSVLILFASVLLIGVATPFFYKQFQQLFARTLGEALATVASTGDLFPVLSFALARMSWIILPVLAVFWLVSFSATLLQVGFVYNEEALQIRWDRLDPVAGFKRLLTKKAMIEGLKSIIKVTLI